MSKEVATEAGGRDVEALLDDVVFDMMPSEGFDDALSQLPAGATIAVTLAPDLGIEPTVERTETATDRGYEVVPHIAPRFIADRDELERVLDRLKAAGVDDIFVPGGDRDRPVGTFSSSYEMLVALDEMGYSFEEIGIAGYPTGHESIDDATLAGAMEKKEPFATYIVTQLTFESEAILEWIRDVRRRGIDLPVEVGLPGVMDYRRLMQLSRKWGVTDPLQFVRKTTGVLGFARKLVGSWGRYEPDGMVADLAPHWTDPQYNFHRARLYTFNQTADTERWRRRRLAD